MTRRRAMTVLEIVVALSIVALLMTAVLQCFAGVRAYVGREAVENDLAIEGRQLLDRIIQDLSQSAWYIPPPGAYGSPFDADLRHGVSDGDRAADRSLRYYPYVQVPQQGSPWLFGVAFHAYQRPDTAIIDPYLLPNGLPPDHRQPSHEIVFLRIADADPAPTPRAIERERIGFDQPDVGDYDQWVEPPPIDHAYLARFSATSATMNLATPSLALDVGAATAAIAVRWEGPPFDAALGADRSTQYREYSYQVLPDATSGKGRLVRCWRNAAGNALSASDPRFAVHRDEELSGDVDRIVFDTWRTDATLNLQQVRFTIWLSRATGDGQWVTRTVQSVAAMRSVDGFLGLQNLEQRLGRAGDNALP